MAYFSNGTEGIEWEQHWCTSCVNYRLVDSLNDGIRYCPILEAHFLWNGKKEMKELLDLLIPRNENGRPSKCSMWLAGNYEIVKEQSDAVKRLREWNEAMGAKEEK
jgi:hypothetical protein